MLILIRTISELGNLHQSNWTSNSYYDVMITAWGGGLYRNPALSSKLNLPPEVKKKASQTRLLMSLYAINSRTYHDY